MAKNRIAGYSLEQRLVVADTLINGRDYDTVREQLQKAGVVEAEMPSDHSLRTYQESAEYHSLRRQRLETHQLLYTAGLTRDGLAARITLIQDRGVRLLEEWMERGLLEAKELQWFLGFTLKYQQLELARERLALQAGRPARVEPPAKPFLAMTELVALVGAAQEQLRATGGAGSAPAEAAEAAEPMDPAADAEAAVAADAAALLDAVRVAAARGAGMKTEENTGKPRIPADADVADDEPEAAWPADAVAMSSESGLARAAGRKTEENAGKPRIPADAAARFANSPSAATRQAARRRRKRAKR